jgi:hypothetical protein
MRAFWHPAACWTLALGLLVCVASPAAAQDPTGPLRIFGGIDGTVTHPLETSGDLPGVGAGAQLDLGPWFAAWLSAAWQPQNDSPNVEWEPRLKYQLGSASLITGFSGRLNFAHIAKRRSGAMDHILAAFEISAGPILGLALYSQTLAGEQQTDAWVPLAGVHVQWNIWFAPWIALRMAADFSWSLSSPVGGERGVQRSQLFLGPEFRF